MSKPFGRGAAARAVVLMTGSTYFSFAIGLVVSAVIARGIGPEDFGRYSYVVWLSGLLVMFANNGLTTTGIRFVSESLGRTDGAAARSVHGWLLRWQYASLALVVIGFVLLIPYSKPANWSAAIALFAGVVAVSVISKGLYLFDISIAKGYGRFEVEAASTVVLSAVNLLCVGVLYVSAAPLSAYLILFALASLGYFGVARWMCHKRSIVAEAEPVQPELSSRVRRHLGWTVVLTLAAALSNKAAETYLLNIYVGPAEVGFFAIGVALTRGGVELLAAGVNSVLMPLMAHGYGEGGDARVRSILSDSLRLYGFGGLLLAGVGFLWADVVVTLMYGDKYHQAVDVFRVMILIAGATLSQSAFGALLSTTDKQSIRAGVAVVSVLVSATAAILLVPRWGLLGAVVAHAVSTIIIYAVVCLGMIKVFSVAMPWAALWRLATAALVAAGVAAGLLALSSSLMSQFAAGLIFAATYLFATVLFGAWRAADFAQLQPLAARYPAILGRALPWLVRHARG